MRLIFLVFAFFSTVSVFPQNGKIVEQTLLQIHLDSLINPASPMYDPIKKILDSVDVYRITYLSDGLKVKGYMDVPKKRGKFPCIIYNRGGNREYGKLDLGAFHLYEMAQMASWGYCVVGSQYRGNDGGDGSEEFGGADVNDVLNLIPYFNWVERADTSRIGMWGVSRGGMMTYLTLTKTCSIKAAVVLSGLADFKQAVETRKDIDTMLHDWLPQYRTNKEEFMKQRSPIEHAAEICKTTPIFIIQGTSDWAVTASQVVDLAKKFYEVKQPFRFSLFEGGGHGVSEFMKEVDRQAKGFFDDYLRNGKKWPALEQRGK